MPVSSLVRFVCGVASAVLVAHLLTSVAVAGSLYAMHSHRIFDLRRFSNDAVANFRLVGTFLNARATGERHPIVVFAGSSVTFGFLWDERVTFAGLFAERHPSDTVLNASIIAADVSAMNDWIVCAARRNHISLDSVVIELPVVNSLSYLVNLQHAGIEPAALSSCDGGTDLGYFGLAATTVRGAGWVRFLWDRSHTSTSERKISIGPVPKGYFASATDFAAVKRGFATQITTTLSNAQSVASAVYAFPSPVFVAGLSEIGEDADAVREQLRAALEACRSVPGVQCVDPSAMYTERSYYDNFTHLNVAGHRAMADLLDIRMGTH